MESPEQAARLLAPKSVLIAIDLYPQRVAIAHYAGHTARLVPQWTNAKVLYGTVGTIDVSFNPATNLLANPVATATLTVAQRTK